MNPYYVYALKKQDGKIFYIGKGVGARAYDHLKKIDETDKGQKINSILSSGQEVVVTTLFEDLTESKALEIEAELIITLGTINNGGILYNSSIPKIKNTFKNNNVCLPEGCYEKAQTGLKILKDSFLELLKSNQELGNADFANYLNLQSYRAGNNYLTWEILGLLIKEGKIQQKKNKKYEFIK